MKRLAYILCLFSLAIQAASQNHVAVATGSAMSGISVKWYAKPVVSEKGYNVYRQEKGSNDWRLVSEVPVQYKKQSPTRSELLNDSELQHYVTLAGDPANLKNIALIAVLVKSFRSEPLCKFLGIIYTDTAAQKGRTFRYKITRFDTNAETEVAQSAWVKCGYDNIESAPQELALTVLRRNVQLHWQPEPMRYYATHIWRKIGDAGIYRRITKDPVLISQTKKPDAENGFYFEDRELPQRVTVYYALEGIDFFGRPTKRSAIKSVVISDNDPPAAVDSIKKEVRGLRTTLRWFKTAEEPDLAGYHVYRTTKNDSDYRRINKKLLPVDSCSFTDFAPAFGQYFYIVAAVDKSGNEGRCVPLFVDVYDNEPPSPPRGISATADSVSIMLTWRRNRETDCAGYLIYRTVNGDKPDTYVKLTPAPVESCVFRDTMPANIRNRIFYKLVAVDGSGNRSDYSGPVDVRLPDRTPPAQPFVLNAKYLPEGAVRVEWLANTDLDIRSYEVFAGAVQEKTIRVTKTGETTENSFVDVTGRAPGVYAYWLVAADSTGLRSQPSNTVYVRWPDPPAETIGKPALNAQYHAGKKEVRLNWKYHDKNLRGVVVFRSTQGKPYTPITGLLSSRSIVDRKIEGHADHYYQLKVYHQNGEVAHSEIVTIKIQPDNESN